jgi:alpha-beta hydrolase superfamily lysophospholipase
MQTEKEHPMNHASGPSIHSLSIASAGGQVFNAALFMPATEPVALMQIYHGMAEHWRRYQPLIDTLSAAGYAVLVHNHQGHGERQPIGHIPYQSTHPENGWQQLINDARSARQAAQRHLETGIPIIVLGHSMGSFVALTEIMQPPEELAGVILSGSGYQPRWLCQLGQLVARMVARCGTSQAPSALLSRLAFAGYNQRIKQASGTWDWLTRDATIRQQYRADPLCGFDCSAEFWQNFFMALGNLAKEDAFTTISHNLPILLLSGDQDPVGQYGRGVRALDNALRRTGHDQVTTLLYPGGRHEMFNETNADQVRSDLLKWLNTTLTHATRTRSALKGDSGQQRHT